MAFKKSSLTPCAKMGQRLAAVVVTAENDLSGWAQKNFIINHAPEDADGGSAAPISHDGYFLTANHVIAACGGKNIYVIYANGGNVIIEKARTVWTSYASDLALLHIPKSTPYHYQWSSLGQGLPPSQLIYHGGMHWRDMIREDDHVHAIINGWICNETSSPNGKLRTGIAPDGMVKGDQKFKMSTQLEPGDSGGPIVDPHGNLIGINSQVEVFAPMKTPIFINSVGVRPNLAKIHKIIGRDR